MWLLVVIATYLTTAEGVYLAASQESCEAQGEAVFDEFGYAWLCVKTNNLIEEWE